jgi:hypothetical protein
VGVDIAKSVMQVHRVDARSDEIVNKPVKRALFLEYFANRPPLSGRHGVLWRLPALGETVDRNGASGQTDAGESRQMTLAYGSMPLFFLGHGEGRPFLLRTNLPTSEAKAARHTHPSCGELPRVDERLASR